VVPLRLRRVRAPTAREFEEWLRSLAWCLARLEAEGRKSATKAAKGQSLAAQTALHKFLEDPDAYAAANPVAAAPAAAAGGGAAPKKEEKKVVEEEEEEEMDFDLFG